MQTKHTTGPWVYDEIWSLIKTPKGEEICALHTGVAHTAQNAKRFNKAIAQANARLIAEAGTVTSETGLTPRQLAEQRQELLEACKLLLECREAEMGKRSTCRASWQAAEREAKAAIAKATGGQL